MAKPRVPLLLSLALSAAALVAVSGETEPTEPVAVVRTDPTDDPASFTFGTVGDHGSNADSRAVLRSAGGADLDFFLSLGDLSYDTIAPEPWCQLVKDELNAGAGQLPGAPFGETFPFALVQGNHDASTIDRYVAPGCLPDRLDATVPTDGAYGEEYYVDYPTEQPLARFVVASPGLGYGYEVGSPHRQWLVDAIDSARAQGIRWVIVVDHLNYVSAGSKRDEIGAAFFDLLVAKQVDLVLQGHDHTYQRSKQLALSAACPTVPAGRVEPACITDDGADGNYPAGGGTVVLINGLGGAENYPLDPVDPETGYFASLRGAGAGGLHGFSSFTVSETSLVGTFVESSASGFADTFSIGEPPSAPDAVVRAESWSGTDGAWWPWGWTSSVRSGVVDVQGEQGRLLVDDVAGGFARSSLSGVRPTADTDLLLSYAWSGASAQSYLNVFLRGSGGWQSTNRPMNGYGLNFVSNSSRVTVQKNANGVLTNLAGVPGGQDVGTGRQWLRFRVVGDRIMFRTWPDGEPEPATWDYTGTDASVSGPGRVFVNHVRGSANVGGRAVLLDDLVLTELNATADTTAPSAPTAVVARAVDGSRVELSWEAAVDDRGVAAYEVVRDGTVLTDAATGTAWSDTTVQPGTSYAYTVRAHDAAGNASSDSEPVTVTTPAPDPIVHEEPWATTDGSAWPSVWSSSASRGAVDVRAGRGRLLVNDVSGSFARSTLAGVPATTHTDLLLSYGWTSASAQSYFNVFVRGSGGWQNGNRPRTGYGLNFTSNSSRVTVQKNVNGVLTTLAAVPVGQQVGVGRQWLRVRVVGDRLMFRTWPVGSTEPAAWAYRGSDTSVPGPGRVFLTHVRGSSNTGARAVLLDDLVLTAPTA